MKNKLRVLLFVIFLIILVFVFRFLQESNYLSKETVINTDESANNPFIVCNEVIVTFVESATAQMKASAIAKVQGEIKEEFSAFGVTLIQVPGPCDPRDAIEVLRSQLGVKSANVNGKATLN